MDYTDDLQEAERQALEWAYPEPTHYTEDLRPVLQVRAGVCPTHGRVSARERAQGGPYVCLYSDCSHIVELLPDDQQPQPLSWLQ